MHHNRTIIRAVLGALILIALVPTPASAMSRSSVLARGKVWVTKNVPYSKSRYAKIDGSLVPTNTPYAAAVALGYRTDCSGFVSMCLKLTNSKGQPMSLATDTLGRVLTPIAKNEIQSGDVILRPKGPNVAYGHAVMFMGWADPNHTSYWTYEESNSRSGAISRKVTYPFGGERGFAPYRYVSMDNWFTDCQSAILGSTRYKTAAAAARISFPTTVAVTPKTLVVSNGEAWTGNLGAAALAGACKTPLLITGSASLTATTAAAIKRFKPGRVYVVGGVSAVSTTVTASIAKLGPKVVRIGGHNRYEEAANTARWAVAAGRRAGHRSDTAYLVGTNDFAAGLAVAPMAARVARPVLLALADAVPAATLDALKATRITKVIIIGGTSVVGSKVVSALRKRGIRVSRIAGPTPAATAFLVAHHGIALKSGFSWSHLGVASSTNVVGVLPCAVAQGEAGSLLMFTPARSLDASTAAEITEHKSHVGQVRVFGDFFAVEQSVRAAIAKLMRAKP